MIETTRHHEVFDSAKYKDNKIVIVGAGAIGSRVFENLVSTGLTNIKLIDYDVVESHNLANQLFTRQDLDKSKVGACESWMNDKCGPDSAFQVDFQEAKVEAGMGSFVDGDILISCVDSFAARSMLIDMAVSNLTPVFMDTRMASNNAEVYMVDTYNPYKVKEYKATIGDDDDPNYEVSACGSSLTVGSTAQLAGAMAAWNVMTYFRDGYIEPHLRIIASPFELVR